MSARRWQLTGIRVGACFYALGIPAGLVNLVASAKVRDHAELGDVLLLDALLLAVSLGAWFAPWARWPDWTQLSVLAVGSAVTVATDRVYGYSAAGAPVDGTIVFVVFSSLWIGLTQRRYVALTLGPLTAAPVIVADAAKNGSANVVTAIGMLAMSIFAAECIAFSRQREQALVRQLRNVVSLSRHFDMTVPREGLLDHLTTVIEEGLGATEVSIDGEGRTDTPATARRGARGLFAGDLANRRIELLVPVHDQSGLRVRATLAEAIPAKAIGSLDLLLRDTMARFVDQHQAVTARLRTDPLTQLGNRIAADEALDRLVAGDAVLLVDVDHFKNVNDTFGHASGDAILQHVASFLRTQLRSTDELCRFGGDELLVVLHGCHDPQAASRVILERWQAQQPPVTLSAGLAVCRPGEAGRTTLARADDALYVAKHGGRARLSLAE